MRDKKAVWLYCEDKTGQDGWRCSSCGFFEPWYYEYHESARFIEKYHYCPKCRAHMTNRPDEPPAPPVITITVCR